MNPTTFNNPSNAPQVHFGEATYALTSFNFTPEEPMIINPPDRAYPGSPAEVEILGVHYWLESQQEWRPTNLAVINVFNESDKLYELALDAILEAKEEGEDNGI